MHTTV